MVPLRNFRFRIYEFPFSVYTNFRIYLISAKSVSVLCIIRIYEFLISVLRNLRIVRISAYELSVLVFSGSGFSILRVLSVVTPYWCMFI